MVLKEKILLILLVNFMLANGNGNEKNIVMNENISGHKRDIFSYYRHSKDAKNKVFIQKMLRELLVRIEEKKQKQMEQEIELERKVFQQYLSSRIKGSFSNDFLTLRY